jgi:uncharacterized protein YdeI (YjbR/CyaY-like superfamily)
MRVGSLFHLLLLHLLPLHLLLLHLLLLQLRERWRFERQHARPDSVIRSAISDSIYAIPTVKPMPPSNSTHPMSRAEWRAWLQEHHARDEGVWCITYKKATGKPRVEYDEAVEEALCYGWIDSKPNKLDDERSMLWFAPRKRGTGWSKPNKERVERMQAAGLMHASGLIKVEEAKADGSWTALDAVEALELPPDLAEALARLPHARQYWDAFPRSAKRGILEWIQNAKRTETRAARIAETARSANVNARANQWRK